MKSSAPWSVKGIERDARETAKEAARRQGMTVGEWLNQMIYTAGDPEASDGEIEGLKLRDLVTAIEHLHKRLADADAKSGEALNDLTRQFGGVVERLQRLERIKPADGGQTQGGDYDALAARLTKLEEKGGDRQRVAALQALEKAVGQVAVQFNTAHQESLRRLDATEQQMQQLGERIDSLGETRPAGAGPDNTGALLTAVEGLSKRVARAEAVAEEAAKLREDAMAAADPDFVERTGERLRVLGDEIKRGGDQIRSLETALAKIGDQIEAAEKRSADGVQKVTETIAELRRSFTAGEDAQDAGGRAEPDHATIVEIAVAAARQTTESHIGDLQSAVREVASRLERGAAAAPAYDARPEHALAEDHGEDAAPEDATPQGAPEETAWPESVLRDGARESDDDDAGVIDPFSFSEAEFDDLAGEPDKSEAAGKSFDDFAFDLDDDDADRASGEIAADKNEDGAQASDADDPMAEIAEPGAAMEAPGDADAAPREDRPEDRLEDRYDDLDDILADLDPAESRGDRRAEDEDATRRAATRAFAAPQPATLSQRLQGGSDADGAETDPSGGAREGQPRPTRRNLTAKQKAILAARARQKRKAAGQAVKTKPAPVKGSLHMDDASGDGFGGQDARAFRAPGESAAERDLLAREDDPSSDDAGGGFGASAIKWMKARVSRGGERGKSEQSERGARAPAGGAYARDSAYGRDGGEEDFDSEESGERSRAQPAFAALKGAPSARPLTLALGGATLLALGALFFLVKDVFFKPDADAPAPAVAAAPAARPTPQQAPRETARQGAQDDADASASTQTASGLDAPAAGASADGDSVISPRTLYMESISALNAADSPEAAAAAIAKLEEAAALGHPPAQLQLGELYKTGQGVEQDLGQARIWFRRSANGGNVLAMHRIGVMTARGDGGPADPQAAVTWFERAANRGLVDSQYNLGAIFHPTETGGAGVQDAGEAYYWYSLASRNGDAQAEPLAAGVSGALSAAERQEIDRRVTSWKAEEPDPVANEVAPTG